MLWFGVFLCVTAIVLFFLNGREVSSSRTTRTTTNEDGSVVFVSSVGCGSRVMGWKEQIVYLWPLVPGIVLIISGRRMRKMIQD